MLTGKTSVIYTIMKIALYATGCWEYLTLVGPGHMAVLVPAVILLVASGFVRQYFLLKNDTLRRYAQASLLLDLALGAAIAWLRPVAPALFLLAPAIIESAATYSLAFGIPTNAAALIALVAIDAFGGERNGDWVAFTRNAVASYTLGFMLIYSFGYLASLQYRERKSAQRSSRELEQAYKQLLDNASKIQELSAEKERNRMAGEIHDILAHTLTAVVVQLEACKKLIDADAPRAKAEIEKAQELTRAGLGEVRRTVRDLRPRVLEECCLMHALNNLFEQIEESTHVCVALHENLNQELALSSPVEVAVFRVLQESITNAIRHGAAEHIDITLTEKENSLAIDISDNGRGCAHIKEGYGMQGIVERIKGLGGTVHFASAAGKGFHTRIAIPYMGGIANGN